MATAKQRDEAIRNYLLSLSDPGSLKDEGAITKLEKALAESDDPLERVKLQAELTKATTVWPQQYEQDFVEQAKEWSEKNDVPAEAFLAEGVPEDVLVQAGLLAKSKPKPRRTRRTPTRTRVSGEEVLDLIRSQPERFTTSDIENVTGASAATVRKYIQQLVDEGVVVEEGPDPDHQGRGRAPLLYSVAG